MPSGRGRLGITNQSEHLAELSPRTGIRSPLTFLPGRLRPNRGSQICVALPEVPRLCASAQALCTALQRAVEENFAALLTQSPPVPLDREAFATLDTRHACPHPWWRRVWARLAVVVAALLRRNIEPDLPASGAGDLLNLATPDGSSIFLGVIIEQALSDAGFRLRLGNHCRMFLEERVLFHPGPPPAPLFSPGGMAMLIATQERHRESLGAAYPALHRAARCLRGPGFVLGFWDQWLLRRMQDTPGWILPDDLPQLPWPTIADTAEFDAGSPLYCSVMELVP